MPEPATTIRGVYERLLWNEPLADSTRQLRRHQLGRWERLSDNPPIDQITTATLDAFRQAHIRLEHSPEYAETDVSFVMRALRVAHDAGLIPQVPKRGRRRRGNKRKTARISLIEFDRFLSAIPVTKLSRSRKGPTRDVPFWVAFFGSPFFCALRRLDLLRVEWQNFGSEFLEYRQSKTGNLVRVPIHPVWRRMLSVLPNAWTRGRVFGINLRSMNRDLHRIIEVAGTKGVTLQSIRVLAARSYERAHAGAGRLILGRPLPGADSYYFDVPEILQLASEKLILPPCLLTDAERNQNAAGESYLIESFRQLRNEDREAVLKFIAALRRPA